MPRSCAHCGASMPEVAAFCPACGRSVAAPTIVIGASERLIAMLAYFTFVPAVIFLLVEPHKRKRFVRFHSFQSVFAWAAVIVVLFLGLLTSSLGWAFGWLLLGSLFLLALFFLWLVLSIKALQGEVFKLPVLGDLAEKQAERI